MNKLMYSTKFGTSCCWTPETQWRVKSQTFSLIFQTHHQSVIFNCDDFNSAIEVIEKKIKKRDGTAFLWRLLVRLEVLLKSAFYDCMIWYISPYSWFTNYYCICFIFLSCFQERGYKLAKRPEAGIANEKAQVFESAYFN